MKKIFFLTSILFLFLMVSCNHKLKYPVTKKVDVVDNYFGIKVADPYRWLENDTSVATAIWVKEQNEVTNDYLSKIPFREKIREKLTKIWNYPKYGVPFREGPWYFYTKNNGLQNQSVLYIREGLNGSPRILLDPNTFSHDGTIALAGLSASRDGKYLAYSIARSGSDWNEICVLENGSGKVIPDTLKWVKFSGMAWKKDGFYYSRYEEPKQGEELTEVNKNQKVYYHIVGTPQKADRLIYENKKFPEHNYNVQVTEDEHFLILYESETTTGNAIWYQDLNMSKATIKLLAPGFENDYHVIGNVRDKLIVMTNLKAPKKKLILMDPAKPDTTNWKTIIPERDDVLEAAHVADDKIISTYMEKAISKAFVYNLNGKFLYEMELPGLGTLSGINSRAEDKISFYGFSGFLYPATIFKYDVANNKSTIYNAAEIDFNPDEYETTQVSYLSKDKTTITMFIVNKKGIKLDGNNPTLLYGYGGFNISMTPSFSISRTMFLSHGGIYAVANIRGGGEYGEKWHQAGMKEKKQNVFDDFIAAAEYLINEKYTSPEKLAIMGGSNGGLLIGACMTQRPELFRVAIPEVGVMDMLRYQKFTMGRAWASDFGTSDTKEAFEYLYKYSPLHNLKKGVKYPATLAITGDHDDRVVPMHTFKFISTLQEDQAGEDPIIVRIETNAGHGSGKPTTKVIDQATDIWSFVMYNLGMTVK
jgi:prolyl oligopeptidase